MKREKPTNSIDEQYEHHLPNLTWSPSVRTIKSLWLFISVALDPHFDPERLSREHKVAEETIVCYLTSTRTFLAHVRFLLFKVTHLSDSALLTPKCDSQSDFFKWSNHLSFS